MLNISLYNTYGIYGIRNIVNNKIYVGKTEMNFGDRKDCHFATLRGGYHINPHLQKAYDKYGGDNFEFIILHECLNHETSNIINELEMHYIKLYKNKGLAYNIGNGGDGGHNLGKHLSAETKRKIGEKNKINMTGRKATVETKQKMSKSQKERIKKMSDEELKEHGRKISESSLGHKWSNEAKENFSNIQKIKPNSAKYSVEAIKEIRRLHENKKLSYTEISKKLDIPRGTVYLIATYRRWKHIA